MSFSLDALYHNASWAIYSHSRALMELQEKSATGQEINRTSDDPIDADRILDLKADSRSMESYISTLEESTSILELAGSVIQNISGEIADAMTSLTSVLSGINNSAKDPNIRAQLSDDIDNILEQIISLANTKRMGRRLFSGADSDIDPYVVTRGTGDEIVGVAYQGSYEERKVQVAPGVEMSIALVGEDLFKSDERTAPLFTSHTGAAAGGGTSSVRGDIWLEVRNIVGNNADVSIDGGTTWVTVNTLADTNRAIVHPDTGEVLYLDATGIVNEGKDRVRFPGTYDIFNSLISIRDMLKNQNTITRPGWQTDWHNIMDEQVEALRGVEQKLISAFPEIGGKISTLTQFKESLEDLNINTKNEISRFQDADISQVAVDLARHEVLYQMSLKVASKLFKMSILDYM